MAYIKSHSNYVIKEKHQLTNDGTIFERDIATVGGLNRFATDQVPIYQNGNFIITVNNELSQTKDYNSGKWEKNGDQEVWTLSNIEKTSKNEKSEDTNKIVFKRDFYDLADFAYYGSCSELIRASITDIINKFPGELYAISEGVNVYYDDGDETKKMGEQYGFEYLVDNPFGIDLNTMYINKNEIDNELRYFGNDLYENFVLIDKNGNETEINNFSVTANSRCVDVGMMVARIEINHSYFLGSFMGDGNKIVYLTNKNGLGYHIRPKKEFYDKFFNNLDEFQKVLLNRESKPKYTAIFEILKEGSFGYESTFKKFTFPVTYGGYNLAINDRMFSAYIDELSSIASFYDEVFCDNLYRNMTHESIKNFDWSYTREYENGDEDEYVLGGSKVQKLLRLIGREFDEIKVYIDNINNNSLSYDNKNNLADYFLTDILSNDGWEVNNIYPLSISGENVSQDTKLSVNPYISNNNLETDFFWVCNNGKLSKQTVTDENKYKRQIVDNSGSLRNRIMQYNSDKEYNMSEVNNHFLKMLKLNSKNIFRHKGSIEGIEMVLGMFGLKSQRYIKEFSNNSRYSSLYNNRLNGDTDYDYKIIEYTTFTAPIIETGTTTVNSYNKTKTLIYDTNDYRNGIYNDYQGLPVRYYNYKGSNIIYPYYSPNKIIDGNPYYQMNGGWLHKPIIRYNSESKKYEITSSAYTETIKNIKSVNTLKDLVSIPYFLLTNGEIYFVKDLSVKKMIINGMIYDIYNEYIINGTANEYIKVFVSNHSINLGNIYFYDKIVVSDKTETSGKTYDLQSLDNGSEIRIYINSENTITVSQDEYELNGQSIFEYNEESGMTHYFKIVDRNHKSKINESGWVNLKNTDEEYLNLNNLKNEFKGNNPHRSNFKYDDGFEYISYFTQLFKYAIENEAFDDKKYKSYSEFLDALDKIKDIGFDELIKPGSTCEYNIYEDPKLHYFCDTYNKDGKLVIFNDNDVLGNDKTNTLFSKKCYSDIPTKSDSGNLDQIVNIKRVDIIFNLKFKDDIVFKMYLDRVILEYLTQIIPSNVILHIEYKER